MISGKRHGDLARRIAEDIKKKRRLALGLDRPPLTPMVLPNTTPEDKQRRELEGGIVIVGRPTFKEFMAGLKRGWTEGLEVVDREEELAKVLQSDGKFDEPDPELDTGLDVLDIEGEPIPTASRLPPSQAFPSFGPPHLRGSASTPSASTPSSSIPPHMNVPPARIPPQPPILFVHFVNHIGLTQIPTMIWEFFNERYKVRSGAEAAYRLIMRQTRPFIAPPVESVSLDHESLDSDPSALPAKPHLSEVALTDLDFDKDAESYYKKSLVTGFTSSIDKARTDYYASLPARLETARALARGTREATKDEQNHPPPTEVELRAERMKKELRWRADEEGWEIIKPEKDVEWDERLRGVLQVFTEPPHSASNDYPGEAKGKNAS